MYNPSTVIPSHYTIFCSFLKQNNVYYKFFTLTKYHSFRVKYHVAPLSFLTCNIMEKGWEWKTTTDGREYWSRINVQWQIYYLKFLLKWSNNDASVYGFVKLMISNSACLRDSYENRNMMNELNNILKKYDNNCFTL